MTIWNAVILAAMLQGFILFLFLLTKKRNRRANIILAFLVLLYSIDIGLETLYSSQLIFEYPHFIGLNDPIFFLYGPLLYLYAYFLTSSEEIRNKTWLLNFVPFLLVVFFYLPTFYLQSAEFKLVSEGKITSDFVRESIINETSRGYIELASAFHELIYIILTLILLKKYQNTIRDAFSAIDRINLNWLRILTLATGIIVLVDIILYFSVSFEFVTFGEAVTSVLFLCALLIYAIGYMGLMQPEIFSPVAKFENILTVTANEETREKYSKSKLTDEQAEYNVAKLLELMETEELFLDGELKLQDVAEALMVSSNNLSQIINDKLNKNFYDFVNGYRVETAKKLLVNPKKQHLTLLAIAFDSGFNSKSSFNSVFKKQCLMTPSEFKKVKTRV